MICVIQIFDEDGAVSVEVRHTVSEEIVISQYGERQIELDYDQARALHRALGCMMQQFPE